MNKPLLCLTAVVTLASASCSKRTTIYPVSGQVNYEGRPAVGAAVFFYRHQGDPQNDPLIMGIVKQDGCFELACGSLGMVAPAGDYDVVIEWKQRPSQNVEQRRLPDKLHGRYADPRHPLLHAKIEAEANQLSPFDLTAKPRAVGMIICRRGFRKRHPFVKEGQ